MAQIAQDTDVSSARSALLSSGLKVAVAASGAGAGISKLLWSVPGASSFLVETRFPYHRGAMQELVGRDLASYSSREAAIALAASAYSRAQEALVSTGETIAPESIVAAGATCAVATSRERRGSDRIHIAVRKGFDLSVASVELEKGFGGREWQGEVCDMLILNAILAASSLTQVPLRDCRLKSAEIVESEGACSLSMAAPPLPDLQGLAGPVLIDEDGRAAPIGSPLDGSKFLVLSGSFNPLHFGHEHMAHFAEAMTGKRVLFEITAQNADKSPLAIDELIRRTFQFRGRYSLIVTPSLPRFVEKARVYGTDFVVGADTAKRICDEKFYGSREALDAAMAELRSVGRKFHVAGRVDQNGKLVGVEEAVPSEYRDVFVALPGRWDVSSTLIRKMRK